MTRSSTSSTSKVLRIFFKDTRHLWPEILISLVFAVGYAVAQHATWPLYRATEMTPFYLAGWMSALRPLSWFLLVVRATHDEPLAGDRQFWITRPYTWSCLLLAKALFFAVYILLPFLWAEAFLLHQAGLHPTHVIPGLLGDAAAVAGFFLLPFFALAAITSGMVRIVLSALGAAVYGVLWVSLLRVNSPSRGSWEAAWIPHTDRGITSYSVLVIPVVCLAVVLIQYAQRRARLSSGILLAVVFFSPFVAWIQVTHLDWKPYPVLAAEEKPPVRFFWDPAGPHPDSITESNWGPMMEGEPQTDVHLLFSIRDVAPSHMVQVVNRRFLWFLNNQKSESVSWNSEWGSLNLVDGDFYSERFNLSTAELHRNPGAVWRLHVENAVNEFEAVSVTTVRAGSTFDVPQNGHCVARAKFVDGHAYGTCSYAIRQPELTRFQYPLRKTCGVTSPEDSQGDAWLGTDDPGHHDFMNTGAVVPMYTDFPTLSYHSFGPVMQLCDGDRITVTRYRLVRRRIVPVDIPAFDPSRFDNIMPPSNDDN